jgi:hypothetical protein
MTKNKASAPATSRTTRRTSTVESNFAPPVEKIELTYKLNLRLEGSRIPCHIENEIRVDICGFQGVSLIEVRMFKGYFGNHYEIAVTATCPYRHLAQPA